MDDRHKYPYLLRTGPNGKVASKVSDMNSKVTGGRVFEVIEVTLILLLEFCISMVLSFSHKKKDTYSWLVVIL